MAYQKLQTYRALPVVYSDTINIPNIMTLVSGGTNTAVTATKLEDTTVGHSFITDNVKTGDIVMNTTTNTIATVTAVDSATVLSLSADIFLATPNNYSIFPNDNNGCVLYIGGAGNIRVLTTGEDDVTFTGVLAGTYFPVQVLRVYATGTTVAANTINALW